MTTPTEQTASATDPELSAIAMHIKVLDPFGLRIGRVLRRTYDLLLDGQHTGRYRWDQLHKTEKTHFGTLVEINLQREFVHDFKDGKKMDFAILGVDVDCKFSQKLSDWMIPPEAMGHLLLGLWANDAEGKWSAGLIRATTESLTAPNRDLKRRLSKAGKAQVTWLFEKEHLPDNALLQIDPTDVEKILSCSKSGSKRLDMLFRLAQGLLISRAVVATVAQQEDYMRRVRGNGGSRGGLKAEGIVIIGQFSSHTAIAEALDLPIPGPGESVSIRLASRKPHHCDLPCAIIEQTPWVVALPTDPVETAPTLPTTRNDA